MAGEEVWRQFLASMHDMGLAPAGETIVAGVSGGPDSLVLLHLLRRLRDERWPALRLIAAHLDHGIRADAGEDAAFVASVADAWGVEYAEERVDTPALRARSGLSLEEAARVARYGFLRRVAEQYGAAVVAVAHHADDQVETVVMHWLRGAGLAGLRGMTPCAWLEDLRLGDESGAEMAGRRVRLIRPLLGCWRRQIEDYCAEHGLTPRFDRSNLDTTIYRNRLRHELIPYLEEFNPNIREVVRRSAAVLARDYDYLHGQVLRAWAELAQELEPGVLRFELKGWRGLHPCLQAGLLREAVRKLRRSLRNINEVHIDDAARIAGAGRTGQRATLPGELMLTVGYRELWIAEAGWSPPAERDYPQLASADMAMPVAVGGVTPVGGGWELEAQEVAREVLWVDWEANPDPWTAYLDADCLNTTRLELRARRPGDVFQPLGLRGGTKSVREAMIGAKVPQWARARYPLVWAGEQIAWLPGLGVDERARLRPGSRRVLMLRLRRREDGA